MINNFFWTSVFSLHWQEINQDAASPNRKAPKFRRINVSFATSTLHVIRREAMLVGYVCGFCGMQSCSNKLKQRSKTNVTKYFKVDSSCPYFYAYGEKCSNYLVRCEASKCDADIWKYNMLNDYQECHSSPNIPDDFIISVEEKKSISVFKN